MSLLPETKNLLKKYDIQPSKGLGQNFLINKDIFSKIIEASDISSTDIVLEIGPGTGNLTKELAQKAKGVIVVEKDKRMINFLYEHLKDFQNIEIINKDILDFTIDLKKYKLVANLPYYITSPVIRKFLEKETNPSLLVLMVQKEVAQRICAGPPKMSLLSVSVQFYAEPKIISFVSKKYFWPSPKVDSAILKIIPQKKRGVDSNLFFRIVKLGFSHPRKQLVNNLLALNGINGVELNKEKINRVFQEVNLNSLQRAESLSVDDWIRLVNNFKKYLK